MNQTKKVVALIGYLMTWFIMFPILVLTGIFHIAMDKVIDNEGLNIIPNQDDTNQKKTNKIDELDLDEEGNLGGRL
tara:strand:- start:869 stop:1096 length:228 start_codon:yes stop_codon:yes gene_type:complete